MPALRALGCLSALACASATLAQPNDLTETLRTTPIRTERLADGFYVLFGVGGNIAVSVGSQGVLAVDTQFPEMVPKYRAAIREVGGGDIAFAINTHWHFDHADGNQTLGPDGTWIVAHANSRAMMTKSNRINLVSQVRDQPAYASAALPIVTFTERIQFHFNGEPIDLIHFGPAHTNGDAAVIFRGRNAVHLGDVFNNAGYPFVDADNGGSLSGIIAFCQGVLDELEPGAIVIPGHGAVADTVALRDYVAMLTAIRDRIAALIADGATLEQVIAARPTEEWDAARGNPENFVNRAYTSLVRERR